jgi:hypothetical protein
MSHKKPLGTNSINQQEIKSIKIDTNSKKIVVEVEVYNEVVTPPDANGITNHISNKQTINKSLSFSDVPNINGILTSINNKI